MDMIQHSNIHEINAHRDLDETFTTSRSTSRPTAPAEVAPRSIAGAWYHDAAIEDARRDAIEARSNPYAGATGRH